LYKLKTPGPPVKYVVKGMMACGDKNNTVVGAGELKDFSLFLTSIIWYAGQFENKD
jgi:hypothetical protein